MTQGGDTMIDRLSGAASLVAGLILGLALVGVSALAVLALAIVTGLGRLA
jgi:hypothetical protein